MVMKQHILELFAARLQSTPYLIYNLALHVASTLRHVISLFIVCDLQLHVSQKSDAPSGQL